MIRKRTLLTRKLINNLEVDKMNSTDKQINDSKTLVSIELNFSLKNK